MILDAVLIGICAWVYVFILMDDGMILSPWERLVSRLPDWLYKPLAGCEYCVAGQMALWYFLWLRADDYAEDITGALVSHILFITLTIFIVELINIWKQK